MINSKTIYESEYTLQFTNSVHVVIRFFITSKEAHTRAWYKQTIIRDCYFPHRMKLCH